MRKWNGSGIDKFAFTELQCQAKQRGYNNLNINCTTEITDASGYDNNLVSIFPNPVQNELNVEISFDLKNSEIKIYNQLGQIQKIISNINNRNLSIEAFDLSNGLYFLVLQNDKRQLSRKFIINK